MENKEKLFTAAQARALTEGTSILKDILRAVEKAAVGGDRSLTIYGTIAKDRKDIKENLEKLGFSTAYRTQSDDTGKLMHSLAISW